MKLVTLLVLLIVSMTSSLLAKPPKKPRHPQSITIDGVLYKLVRVHGHTDKRVDLEVVLDRTGNGFNAFDLTGDESKTAKRILKVLDTDDNGFLSEAEAKRAKQDVWAANKTDDGWISTHELVDWIVAWRNKLNCE